MTAVPAVPRTADAETRRFLEVIKEILEVGANSRSGAQDTFVRYRDLVDAGIAKLDAVGTLSAAVVDEFVTTPEGVSNLSATATFSRVLLDWDFSGTELSYFEVARCLDTETLSDADVIGTTQAQVFADSSIEVGVTYLYFVRAVNQGKYGAWSDSAGVSAVVTDDPLSAIINASAGLDLATVQATLGGDQGFGMIENASTGEKGFAVLADRFSVFDGVDGAVTPFQVVNGEVYINTAVINDASITNAKIQSISADKIVANTLSAISANLGAITAGSLSGPNNRFVIDLANNRLDVYDTSGTLRVRIGDI